MQYGSCKSLKPLSSIHQKTEFFQPSSFKNYVIMLPIPKWVAEWRGNGTFDVDKTLKHQLKMLIWKCLSYIYDPENTNSLWTMEIYANKRAANLFAGDVYKIILGISMGNVFIQPTQYWQWWLRSHFWKGWGEKGGRIFDELDIWIIIVVKYMKYLALIIPG